MDAAVTLDEEKKIGYKDVFTQKEYCKLTIANLISRFGDSVDALAFTWLVYQVTGSAAWSAIIFAMNQLPSVLVQPFAGALVEGMRKKRLMVITDLIRGFIIVCLVMLYLAGNVKPWILVVFTLIISTVEAFRIPASMAIIPKLIDAKYFTHASSLNSTLGRIVELIGMGAAGVIIGMFGMQTAILIDAGTFFVSAIIICFIKCKEVGQEWHKVHVKSYFETLKAGAVYVKTKPVIRNFCFMAIVLNAIMVPINSLQSPMISEIMGQGSELLSVFGIALTIGLGVGSFCFPMISQKISATNCVVSSGLVMGICVYSYTLGRFLQENVVAIYFLTILISFVFGFAVSNILSILSVNFMKVVEQDYLARVGSIFNAGATAATPIASLMVSAFVAHFSTVQILLASSILCVILFLIVGIKKVQFE